MTIDNIFINNLEKLLMSGNIVFDISDHFSQVCITTCARDKAIKIHCARCFSVENFNNDLAKIDWDCKRKGQCK